MATSGNDSILFTGTTQLVSTTLTNAYSGQTIVINQELIVNNGIYDGLAGHDILYMTATGDFLNITNELGEQTIFNIEAISASSGGDVINLSSADIVLGNMTLSGANGNDILWANAGNDTIDAGAGDDIIDGGPGNDTITGGQSNDIIYGGEGDDTIRGGTQDDIMMGGAGNDTYISEPFLGFAFYDTIIEGAGADVNVLILGPGGHSLANMVFTVEGNDLLISAVGGNGLTRVVGQFDTPDSGLDTVVFSDGSTFDLRTIEPPPPANIPTENDDVLTGTADADTINALGGDDTLDGLEGDDTLFGGEGDDTVIGSAGNDVLYGGNNTAPLIMDKDFNDDILFPTLKERTNIKNLNPSGEPALGIKDPNLSVDFDAQATITFRKGFAGYNNSIGVYRIGADGEIEDASLLWNNVKTAGTNIAHTIDLPLLEDGGSYGFFIIANGDNENKGYQGMDTATDGNIQFIYNYGKVDARPATINDNGKNISVVYNDGHTIKVLKGEAYHTTARGDDGLLNPDGKVHSVSGILGEGEDEVLRIGFEDLKNLGDGDFEDVLFDLDIKEVNVDISEIGNDTLIGGLGDDILYGEAGNDVLYGDGQDDAPTASNANLIVNGDFSNLAGGTGYQDKGSWALYKTLEGWNADKGLIEIQKTTVAGAPTGGDGNLLELDSHGKDSNSSISQTVNVTEAGKFVLNFEYSGRANGNTAAEKTSDFNVLVDGQIVKTFTSVGKGFETVSIELDLSAGDHKITFQAAGKQDTYGAIIDNVGLYEVEQNDTLYGGSGNDTLIGGAGNDVLYGGDGSDIFTFTEKDFSFDHIKDFFAGAGGDMLDISEILEGYDPLTDAIADFVKVTNGGKTLQINDSGTAGEEFRTVAVFDNSIGSLDDLVHNGNLIVS